MIMSEQNVQDENSNADEQNSIAQRISMETKRREPNLITKLVLDNCARCHSIQGLTDEFCNLRVLSIINVGLQSLAKFPALSSLQKLYLSDNRLTSGLEHLQGCQNLTFLSLAGNRFKSIDELKPLAKLPKLSVLDLANCEVTSVEGYRETMFNLLPQLKYLDKTEQNGVEKDSDDEDDDESDVSEEEEDDEDDEEDDSKTGLKALYNGTFEEGDDDEEESYEENEEDEDESDEDDDVSEEDVPADPAQGSSKGEKRKRTTDNAEKNTTANGDGDDDDEPPRKI